MAVESEVSSVEYLGNGSTSTGYVIPFPFLDPSHIEVGTVDEDDVVTLLEDGDFTVHEDTSMVTTDPAIASDVTLVVRRTLPLTQPATWSGGGPVRASSMEQALDRLSMQVQQLARSIDGGTATTATQYPSTTFADAAARALAVPARIGHFGVQLDDNSLWRGVSTSAGDWVLVAPGSWTWERVALSGNLSAQTVYVGHLAKAGVLYDVRFCLGYFEANRVASVNIIRNGATNIFSADVDLPQETFTESGSIAVTSFEAGDRIDLEIVSVGAGSGEDPPADLSIILYFKTA